LIFDLGSWVHHHFDIFFILGSSLITFDIFFDPWLLTLGSITLIFFLFRIRLFNTFDIFIDPGYRPFDIFFDLGYRPIDIFFDPG